MQYRSYKDHAYLKILSECDWKLCQTARGPPKPHGGFHNEISVTRTQHRRIKMSFEFCELTSTSSRDEFIARVEEARTLHGKTFRANSKIREFNNERLAASKLFGLFRTHNTTNHMIAGIAMHDLLAFPQSCGDPDLTQFQPRTVVECSDHWSISGGAGMLAWAGLAVPMRMLGVQAVLAYLAYDDVGSDHAGFYSAMGFRKAGNVREHPFVETAAGQPVRVQPVLLCGSALTLVINSFAQSCVGISQDRRRFELSGQVIQLIRLVSQQPHTGIASERLRALPRDEAFTHRQADAPRQ
jgi:hypothetical protein